MLDALCLGFLHLRVERLQDPTDQRADLLGDAARLLDFIDLGQTGRGPPSDSRRPPVPSAFTFLVGIFSFMSSASRHSTLQGAWIFRNPTPWTLVYAPEKTWLRQKDVCLTRGQTPGRMDRNAQDDPVLEYEQVDVWEPL